MRQINSLQTVFRDARSSDPALAWTRNWTSPVAAVPYLAGELHPEGDIVQLTLIRPVVICIAPILSSFLSHARLGSIILNATANSVSKSYWSHLELHGSPPLPVCWRRCHLERHQGTYDSRCTILAHASGLQDIPGMAWTGLCVLAGEIELEGPKRQLWGRCLS
jgi:hypothetical protein